MNSSLVKVIAVLTFLATGCATSPAPWSKDLIFQLRCGMSEQQVERAIGKRLSDESRGGAVRDPRGTHAVQSDDLRTAVWFTFVKNSLRGFTVTWSESVVGYGGMKTTDYVDLCSGDKK